MAPRISHVPVESIDERMQEELHRCAREGTPRPGSSAVRAHAANAFWPFADSLAQSKADETHWATSPSEQNA